MIIKDLYHDLIITIPLFLWILFVIKYFSRWVYNIALRKGYPKNSATYFGRKIIHIFGSGLITLSLPFLFKEGFLPALSAFFLAFYNYSSHRKNQLYNWFQVKENIHEVNFCLMWGLSILIGWFLDKSFWLGVIPALFLSFGDGITGIVRNLKYKKRSKAWEGSLAMFLTCALIGGLKMGLAGVIAALVATIAERFDDDNIYITVSSFIVLMVFLHFFPSLMKAFI